MGVVRLHNNILIKIFILFFNYPAFEFNFLNNIKLLNYLLFYSLVLGLFLCFNCLSAQIEIFLENSLESK